MRACLSVHARATVTRVCPGVSMKVVAFVARPLRPYERADPFFCKTLTGEANNSESETSEFWRSLTHLIRCHSSPPL